MKKMSGTKMYGWKTVQFFLSNDEVCEVQISHDRDLRCTCKGYIGRKNCRHINWCKSQLKNGEYPIEITNDIPPSLLEEAKTNPTAFRNIVLKYGRPLAL